MSDTLTRKFNTLRGFSKSSSTKGLSEDNKDGSSTNSASASKQSITSSTFFENQTNVNRSQTLRPGRNTINHGMEGSMQEREPLSRSLSASQLRKQFQKPLPPPPVPTSNSMPSSPSVLDQADETFQLLRDNTPISSPSKLPPPPPKRSNTAPVHMDTRQKYATMRPSSKPTNFMSDSVDNVATKDENRQSVLLKSLPPLPQKPPSFAKPNSDSNFQPKHTVQEIETQSQNPHLSPKVQASQRTSISPTTSPRESTVVASSVTDSPRALPPLPPKSKPLSRSTSNQSLDSLGEANELPKTPSRPPPRMISQSGSLPSPPSRVPAYATLRDVNSARSHHRWASVDTNTPPTPTQPSKPLPPPPPRTQSTSSLSSPPPRPQIQPIVEDEQTIIEKKERKRTAVVNELIATEITYIESLKKSIEFYQNPFREQLASDPSKFIVDGRPLTNQDVSIVFSNIAMICGFNQQLLEELQSRQKTWNPSTLIGDIFLRLTPFLKLYTEYSNNYDKAFDFLKKASKQCEAVKSLFESVRYHKDGPLIPPIDSLLIAPIQRIPRYNLLLGEMIKSTSSDHPDYQNLNAALTLMQEVANHINNSMKTSENFQKLVAIEEQLVDVPANWEVVIPSRIVLKDGVLTEIKHEGKKKKNVRLILFNDNLLLCRPQLLTNKFKFVFTAPILQLFTIDVSDTPVFCFKIQHPSRTFTVYATSSVEKQNWVQYISDARDKQMEIEGAKMVFKLLKKEEERRVLFKMKSMSTGNLSAAQSQTTMSVRAQSEIERIMMESQKMQRVKQAEEELLKKKKEQEEEEARKKKLERKMKKAARREKDKSETDPDGKERKKKKKKKSKDREGSEKKERKHKKKKKDTESNVVTESKQPNDKPQEHQTETVDVIREDKAPSENSSEDETSQSEGEITHPSS